MRVLPKLLSIAVTKLPQSFAPNQEAMCQASWVYYSMACGHYRLDPNGNACDQSSRRKLEWSDDEKVPCDTFLYELERQRTESWGWKAIIAEKEIQVVVDSSGHCDEWQKSGYQKPNYSKPPEPSATASSTSSGAASSATSSTASTS